MTPTVYVIQQQLKYERGQLVPRFDLSAATKFGKLRFLLNDSATLDHPHRVIAKLDLLLGSYQECDYLLPVGHPSFIGFATAIAAANARGVVKHLVWSGEHNEYRVIEARLPVRRVLLSGNVNPE